jgi:hypothetical protein
MTRGRLLLAALTAALVLSSGAGGASASRSLSIDRGIITATGARVTFEGGGVRVVCPVTFTLTANASRAGTKGGRFGTTTMAVAERSCTGGRARVIGANWDTTQVSFAGSLPAIVQVTYEFRGVAFLVENLGGLGECSFRGNAQVTTRQSGQRISGFFFGVRLVSLERNLGGLFCPEVMGFNGELVVGAGAQPTISLL